MQDQMFEEYSNISFRRNMVNVYTAIPCIVVGIDDDLKTQSLTVQPVINRLYKDNRNVEQPIIRGVPLMFPSSSTSAFTFPVRKGDTVLCVFSQRGLDTFKASNGYPAAPSDFRRFSIRDAVAIPGLFPFSRAINNPAIRLWTHNTYDTVIVHNIGTNGECEIRLKESGNVIVNTKFKVEVNCKDAEVNATNSVTVNTPTTTVNTETAFIYATSAATLETPFYTVNADDTTWTGNMTFAGNITHNGEFVNTGTLSSNTVTLDTHLHDDTMPMEGATSGPPAPGT